MEPFNHRQLQGIVDLERASNVANHPRSKALYESSVDLLDGVPMSWMKRWVGGFPLGFSRARGATITDLDGHDFVDFALGDTGAMAGHSPGPLVEALARRAGELGGVTTMLPSEDAEWVGAELPGASASPSGPSRSRRPTPIAGFCASRAS